MIETTPILELPRLPRRSYAGHKGTYGKLVVVAGSRGMSGAAALCGMAALRAGAGLVQVACPAEVQSVVAAAYPGYTTLGIRQHADGTYGDGTVEETSELIRSADAVAIGPGMGRTDSTVAFVRNLLSAAGEQSIVLDADGLFALSPFSSEYRRSAPFVLTPHPGEFARLSGTAQPGSESERVMQAVKFARDASSVLVLKGAGTLVTDGKRVYLNTTGNPGMATGGTGDVLTGVITALIGQGMIALDAAVLGVWVHGRAGDLGASVVGHTALTAVDVIDYLPAVFRELESYW